MPASGIPGAHEIPLGSHLCLFYRRPKEFVRVSALFLKAGLTGNELCVWILPEPVSIPSALTELAHHGLDGSVLLAKQQLQIVLAHDWFSGGAFNVQRALRQLTALPALGRQLGYSSVRAVGGPGPFLSERAREAFRQYERLASPIIAKLPFIGLCCYATTECLVTDLFDIMSAHPGAFLRTQAGWASI